MLSKAVRQYPGSNRGTKTQQPLQPSVVAANTSKPLSSNHRKFDRTVSSTSTLSALHEPTCFFNENDFDDDAAIDLTTTSTSPSNKCSNVQYPSLKRAFSEIDYPELPDLPQNQGQHPTQSSAPVPWSSSPPTHHQPLPSKRRTVPWLDKEGNDKTSSFTPLPPHKSSKSPYAWNKTASAFKDEQKELRKRNKQRSKPSNAQTSGSLVGRSSIAHIPKPFLSDEQKGILRAVVEDGKSVFFTGSAGTGKSVLMRQIIAKLRDKYKKEPDRVAVTASTGLAACNIEGITLHSFAGIGLGKEPAPELVKKVKRNAKLKQRWMKTKVLIIDEISMVDGDLYDKLEHIARDLRKNGRPFGGIQLVVTGDFFQLPPVPDKSRVAKFAFDAVTWNTSIEHTILLTHVFRQKDPVFAGMLNEMRLGKLTAPSIRAFQSLSRPLAFEDELEATELFPTRGEVDNANNSRMQNLSGELMMYEANDGGLADLQIRERALQYFMAPPRVCLKKGAQVMLIKNMDGGLVNGSLGKVISFMDENMYQFYRKDEETFMEAQRSDAPSDDEEIKKAKKMFEAAVRRDGVSIGRKWPMVRFTLPDNTARTLLCVPEEWKTELPNGEILAKRSQIPLILAWALSIHKAQGQTLERVKVDLGRVFEKGQAYVALSRATNQSGLQVNRFDQKKVMVHPRVVQFYDNLVTVDNGLEKGETTEKGRPRRLSASGYERGFVESGNGDEGDEELKYMYG